MINETRRNVGQPRTNDNCKRLAHGMAPEASGREPLDFRYRPAFFHAGQCQESQSSGSALRDGSVCLNSFGRFVKWISASIMLPPSLVPAH